MKFIPFRIATNVGYEIIKKNRLFFPQFPNHSDEKQTYRECTGERKRRVRGEREQEEGREG